MTKKYRMKRPLNKLLNWYFSKGALPYWCVLIMDYMLLVIAGFITYRIFIYSRKVSLEDTKLLQTLLMYALPNLVGARMFHTYSGIIRYSSFVDLAKVFYANLFALMLVYPLHDLIYGHALDVFMKLHFRHIMIMYVFGTLLMWGIRVLVKSLYEVAVTDNRAKRALI